MRWTTSTLYNFCGRGLLTFLSKFLVGSLFLEGSGSHLVCDTYSQGWPSEIFSGFLPSSPLMGGNHFDPNLTTKPCIQMMPEHPVRTKTIMSLFGVRVFLQVYLCGGVGKGRGWVSGWTLVSICSTSMHGVPDVSEGWVRGASSYCLAVDGRTR